MSATKAVPAPQSAAPEKSTASRSELGRVVQLLNRFLIGQRWVFLVAVAMLVADSLTTAAGKVPLTYLIDFLNGERSDLQASLGLPVFISPLVDVVAVVSVSIVVLALLNSLADALAEIYLAKGGRTLGFKLRAALYAHLQKLSLAFFNQRRTGDLLTRVTSDVTALEDFAIKSLKDIAGSIFTLVISLGTLLWLSWRIAIVTVLMVPLLSFISNYFSDRITKGAKRQRAREGELASAAQEMLASIRVIQTFSRGSFQQTRFAEQSQKTTDVALEVAGLQARFSAVINTLQAVTVALVICTGVWLINGTALSVGELVLAIGLIQDMFKPTKRIIKEWNAVGKIFASVERIGELLDRKPTVQDEPGATELPPVKGYVEFLNVSFAYQLDAEDRAKAGPARQQLRLALNNISFGTLPGEVIALVGGSGAGKSTILQLLPRLYDPHRGQVRLDGQDIRSFTLDSLRSQMSMVLQEAILFTGTVAENIAYGRPEATRDEIIAAAMQANAHEFIEKLPEGYDTPLSERAANLSGGQRQRIAIARAFVRNAPILILDEPTTGLDAESTDLVLAALRSLIKGKTTFIISHDLNLIRNADTILVIQSGQIAEQGTHKELLKAGGVYANLYHKQFGVSEVEHEAGPPPAVAAPQLASDDEEDREAARVADAAFRTLVTQLLPEPISPAAFQTIIRNAAQAPSVAEPISPAPAQPDPPTPAVIDEEAWSPYTTRLSPTGLVQLTPQEQAQLAARGERSAPQQPLRPLPAVQASAIARLERAQIDPLHAPQLRADLPGLLAAFDASAVWDYLQKALFGKEQGRFTIERCVPGKALYLFDDGCALRYQLEVRDNARGERLTPVVNARLFRNQLSSAVYMRDRLAPLARLIREREEQVPFDTLAVLIEPLNMAVALFPIDGDLPTLVSATNPQSMRDILGETLPDAQAGRISIKQCAIETVHYARRGRCVLRYLVNGTLTGTNKLQHQVVYGKVAAGADGELITEVMRALRELVLANPASFHFAIPRPLGWRKDLQLVLMEAITGAPVIDDLLKAQLSGISEDDDLMTLDEALTVAAHVASTLHSAKIRLGPTRTIDDELRELRQEITAMRLVAPELAAQLRNKLEQIEYYAEATDALPFCLNHGNYRHSNLLFDGTDCGLVDYDTVCQAEPALDLGQFLAHLRIVARKTQTTPWSSPAAIIDQLCAHMLHSYRAAAGNRQLNAEQLRSRVAVYEAISLLRSLIHSWRVVKVSRIEHVIAVLEERVAALAAAGT